MHRRWGQKQKLVQTHCSIKNKVCNLIVDNGGTGNMVSQKLVDYLKLSTSPKDKSYDLGWVEKVPPMRDKRLRVKLFNVGDDVTVFLCKERLHVGTYKKLQPFKYGPFNGEVLNLEENLGSSSFEVEETDVGSLGPFRDLKSSKGS